MSNEHTPSTPPADKTPAAEKAQPEARKQHAAKAQPAPKAAPAEKTPPAEKAPPEPKTTPTLRKLYAEQVFPELVKLRGYKNKHEVPKLVKISINSGIDAEADKNQIADVQRDLGLISGQKPVLSKTRKAISNFKLKQNQIVGCHVTLRGDSMWEFLYRLIAVALPTIRDFRGMSPKLDGQGNYNIGISDFTIFPEITVENVKKSMGLDITIVTTAETDDEGRDLLRLLGMPFRRVEAKAETKPEAKHEAKPTTTAAA